MTTSPMANPVAGMAEVIADARLDGSDGTLNEWYLAASPAGNRTIEVATLEGATEPRLEQEEQFQTDGISFRVSIDGGAAATDWRGLQKNEGGP